jgi:putative endonuclease
LQNHLDQQIIKNGKERNLLKCGVQGEPMPALMFWVYLLQNPSGRFYIGHTDDLEHRLYSHNRTDKVVGKYTRKNGPWTLVWSEVYSSRAEAMAREKQIKAWKSSRMIRSRLLGQPE